MPIFGANDNSRKRQQPPQEKWNRELAHIRLLPVPNQILRNRIKRRNPGFVDEFTDALAARLRARTEAEREHRNAMLAISHGETRARKAQAGV